MARDLPGNGARVAWTGQNVTLALPTGRPKLPTVTAAKGSSGIANRHGRARIRLIATPAEPFINQSFTPDGWGRGDEV